ncbi:ATPase [Candidatus Nitrosopelagicus brevis]|jgi:V/A-type H+-transporting ATPase subunit D|uniref:A-type ATP synthase subunit D n=2 Tax=Nitrososphaerota TaxID=651137 RepID=A0A0A7UYV7_9ARCH|nr:V-type ATP synthase subunit D [Candidatus Nitrosopelagicus brevis]AIF08861.1 V-type ATP synthase subunit D (ATPVD, ntpD) [uncultured marine thaumarchaeote KM3_33_B12]MCH2617818.1 V-type ATP synthase subunit D [Candidatus Nitrosopelagicus sp.]MED5282637.1 V-type ATP synthase subunit D [Thermoproteota archaeon]AJA91989.1 V-type ATPase, D subunit [Candidatus Nitrosopelagicus brevis]NMI84197.1 V-type ATP synthase subunit D [Candidatus Nitrosopelagicus brevis]|tara:strand:+ start:98 stop:730 length:633 start_codon:yes stop_codon:yes gene_type:complete
MSFGQNVTATKIELFKYKRSSQVATMVQKILDDKRKVLLKNIEEMIAEAQKTRGGIWEPLQDIYQSVNESYLSLGVGTVDSVAQSTPAVMEVESDVKRVVDVTIPVLSVTEKDTKSIPYGFADTNASIDRGAKLIKDLLPKICKAAEYENSIFSLAKALEKTQKLLNALENVIIPQYKQRVRFILATLEEREREEFARLKKVKASMEKRQ